MSERTQLPAPEWDRAKKRLPWSPAGARPASLARLPAESALEAARAEVAILDRERRRCRQPAAPSSAASRIPAGRPDARNTDVDADLAAGLPAEVLSRPMSSRRNNVDSGPRPSAVSRRLWPKIRSPPRRVASRALATLFAPGHNSWAFQPSLNMPLFDGGRNAGNIDLAEARKIIAVADYEKTVQQAFREVADLLAARTTMTEQRRSAEANLKVQDERLKVAQALFKGGQTGYLDVLDAQREHFAAQQSTVQVRRAQLSASAQLYKALGGGD
jgi:multidrug efflux system outer membrane protein